MLVPFMCSCFLHLRRFYILMISSVLLSGCGSPPPKAVVKDLTQAYSPGMQPGGQVTGKRDETGYEALISSFSHSVNQHWKDGQVAGKTRFVKYNDDFNSRIEIDFENGAVRVETLSQSLLRDALIMTMLAPDDSDSVDVFSADNITLGDEPMLYGQIQDQDGKFIRWKWRASRYADWLIANRLGTRQGKSGSVYSVSFRLVDEFRAQQQYQYAQLVRKYSRQYNVEESLIYAVMRTESSFNPYAVSWANAYGLMQVVPETAGRDVFKLVYQRSGQPGKRYLFNPENNIRTGTAYLHLLQTRYLKDIQDPLARRHAVISAYNGGAGNVFNTFSRSRKQAIARMNQLKSSQVYWALTKRHSRSESRRYLEKVTKARADFLSKEIKLAKR